MSDILDCSQSQDENLAVQIESLTCEDLAVWLNQCNIPQRFCTIFEDIWLYLLLDVYIAVFCLHIQTITLME